MYLFSLLCSFIPYYESNSLVKIKSRRAAEDYSLGLSQNVPFHLSYRIICALKGNNRTSFCTALKDGVMGELYLVSYTTKRLLRQLQERVSKLFKLQRSDRKKSNRPNGFLNTEKFISVFNAKLLHRFVFKVKEPREFVYICTKFLVDRTLRQYREAMGRCRDLFSKKMKDYGTAWRILRVPSLVDQIFIKAKRIRTIEEKGVQAVSDSIETEYIGVVNYSLMALIQLDLKESEETKVEEAIIMESFNRKAIETELLMQAKNHDYGEAWRDMKCSSLTDLILMKVLRIKQIMSNASQTLVSEGLGANFQDITNYAVFALIKIEEQKIKTPGR